MVMHNGGDLPKLRLGIRPVCNPCKRKRGTAGDHPLGIEGRVHTIRADKNLLLDYMPQEPFAYRASATLGYRKLSWAWRISSDMYRYKSRSLRGVIGGTWEISITVARVEMRKVRLVDIGNTTSDKTMRSRYRDNHNEERDVLGVIEKSWERKM